MIAVPFLFLAQAIPWHMVDVDFAERAIHCLINQLDIANMKLEETKPRFVKTGEDIVLQWLDVPGKE